MTRANPAAIAFDMALFDDEATSAPARAFVRGRDGLLRALDAARLAWPDDVATAGVDRLADLSRRGPIGRC